MDTIVYGGITEENFFLTSLDGFICRREVRECWRRADGRWKLLPIAYTDDSGPDVRMLLDALRTGNPAFGAWAEGALVGFALLAKERFGSAGIGRFQTVYLRPLRQGERRRLPQIRLCGGGGNRPDSGGKGAM